MKRIASGGIHCISTCHFGMDSRTAHFTRRTGFLGIWSFCSFYALISFFCLSFTFPLSFSFDIVHRSFFRPEPLARIDHTLFIPRDSPRILLRALLASHASFLLGRKVPPLCMHAYAAPKSEEPASAISNWRGGVCSRKSLAPPVSSPQKRSLTYGAACSPFVPRDVWLAKRRAGRGRLAHTKRADCASPMQALTCAAVFMYALSVVLAKTNLVLCACSDR